MNMSHRFNRRTFLLGSAGAAAMAFMPASMGQAGAQATFPVGANVVTTAALNVRSGAGLTHSIIVTLWEGAPLTVIGDPVWADGYEWYPIRTGYGTEGWVAGSYLASGTVDSPAFADGDNVVTTSALNLREGAGLSYAIVVTLWEGAPLTVIGAPVAASGYTWYPVRTGYGTEGWVAGEFLAAGTVPSPDFAVGANVVTTAALNLREGAGLDYAVIVTLWEGAPLTVIGDPVWADGYEWYPVQTGYGTEGWVAGEYLSAGAVPSPDFPEGSIAETTTELNVREGAGLGYAVIVTLWDGAPVTITGAPVAADGYTWYPIRTDYGTEGWVAGEYLA